MAYISTFFYAEAANLETIQQPGTNEIRQQLHVFQPMHTLTPDFQPCMYSFSIVFGILELNLNSSHTFRIQFTDPDGNFLLDTPEQLLPPQPNRNDLPPDMQGTMINMELRNMPFKKPGTYNTKLWLDGELMGTYPLKVRGKQLL